MADLLFVTLDAGGNVPPMLGVARACAAAGHTIRVLGHERLRPQVEAHGLDLTPYRGTHPWDASRQQHPASWAPMLNDSRLGTEVGDACAARRPDAAIVDCMLPPAHAAVDLSGIPRIVLTHTFKAFYDGSYRRTSGLISRYYRYRIADQWNSARVNLIAADETLDPAAARSRAAGNARWIGVVGTNSARPSSPAGEAPLVLVSLSTNGFPGQRRTLERIVAALGELPVRGIVTVGDVFDPGTFAAPPNVQVVGYVDHAAFLPECALVISHGGHSTAFRALAHGIPLLLIPTSRFTDQPMIARALTNAGVALMARPSASRARIAAAVAELLREPRYRAAAAAQGARLRRSDGAERAVDLIAGVATSTNDRL